MLIILETAQDLKKAISQGNETITRFNAINQMHFLSEIPMKYQFQYVLKSKIFLLLKVVVEI